MAETFVRLGVIHTVREIENYIIDVARVGYSVPAILSLLLKLRYRA